MRYARLVAVVVIGALLVTVVPVPVFAADKAPAGPGLRASVDRAARTLAAQAVATPAPTRRSHAAAMQYGGGGGGGKMMAVITVIGAVGGLAATYFIIKQTRKQTSASQQ